MEKPLWKPSKSRIEESNLYNFYNFLVNKDGLDFKNNYEDCLLYTSDAADE